ncbi:MAG: hypothetical protein CMH70_06700 [Nitrosomonadaceae bacterium]|nr:hypothetical protein [Nitrosomonadaceae bacterium]|tara:strand:+ start:1758 stop:2168 length:411 start_codon:yes stop_codon:yes gene_type:complete
MDDKVRKNNIDWDFWLLMPHVKIWQAVALSIDIDPKKMTGRMTSKGPQFYSKSFRTIKEQNDFDRRCELLIARVLNTNDIRIVFISNVSIDSEIYLNSFVDWVLSVEWNIPQELRIIATAKEKISILEKSYSSNKI